MECQWRLKVSFGRNWSLLCPEMILWSTIHEISSSQAESMACPMRWSSDILLSISDEMQQKIIQLDLSETVIGYPNWISEQRCRFCNETVYIWFTVIQAHSYKGRFICICYLHVSVKTYLIDIKMQYAGEMVSKAVYKSCGHWITCLDLCFSQKTLTLGLQNRQFLEYHGVWCFWSVSSQIFM